MEMPRLITPQGATILLTPELYQAVLRLVAIEHPQTESAKETRRAFIRQTFGKYGGEPSLTQALLQDRAVERADSHRRP